MSDVELKEYIDQRFTDSDKAVQAALVAADKGVSAALASAEKAVEKAETAASLRFEAANDVKATFTGQLNEKLGRAEYNTAHKALVDKIDGVIVRIAAQEGSNKGSELTKTNFYAVLGAVSVILGIIVLLANGVFKG